MSEPIERTDAALRQIENHARAARADLAALRRSPPAPAIDVEGVVTAVKLDICEWCAPSTVNDVEIAMRRAFRSALGGKEQP